MKRGKNRISSFSIFGFFLFFLTLAITSASSIVVYYFANKETSGNFWAIFFSVVGVIFIGAILCCLCDIFRRRQMIDKPAKMILQATDKIASGDFSVKLAPLHEYSKYDQYDLIFDNLNSMTAELNKNEVLKNDFISNVSHEIKTPLSVIQNYAKMLKNENLLKEKRDEYLDGLITQTQRLSSLVANILKLNKLENQELIPENEKFDLAELVRSSALGFENLFEKKSLELVCDIDEMEIESSPSLIELILNNLISNAIKFSNDGGKIEISLKKENSFAVIKVKDWGCGISSETGKHIFDKFYQGDTSHTNEGNGLGLALVKKVIDIIGGEISVESKIGIGSTFTVKIKIK